MRIHYNSRDPQHKTPFGTLRRGELCKMTVFVPKTVEAVKMTLILEDPDGQFCKEIPFFLAREEGDYGHWQVSFTMNTGLYFYWFRIYKEGDSFRLFRQGDQTNMEQGEKWQLSFLPEDFTVPEYAMGSVMYQILPDRFYKAGECDLTQKLQPYTIHEDWNDLPRFGPDEEGYWNNDFFGGNFQGIREKLPYLKTLGVGILYLNPVVMAFSNHRYDSADYKRPDPMLGTAEDFRQLCESAHDLGMRVILDGVFSHTGDHSRYFDSRGYFGGGAVSDPESIYRWWFQFKEYPIDYEAWWGIRSLPCVNELDPGYLDYIIDAGDSVVSYWMSLGADGFRLDVADELPDEFILRLKNRIREIKSDAFLLGEVWEDASNKRAYGVSRRYFIDGELDSVMNYPWRKAILDFVQGTDDGAAFGESVMTIAENYPPQVLSCLMNLLGSHDKPRILTVLGDDFDGTKEEKATRRLSTEDYVAAREKLYLAAFLQYTLPGMPSIYYGDEVGVEGFEDPYCRRTFPWGNEDETIQTYFRALGELKCGEPSLQKGTVRILEAWQGRLCYVRRTENAQTIAYVNRTSEEWELTETGHVLFGRGIQQLGKKVTLLTNGFCLMKPVS